MSRPLLTLAWSTTGARAADIRLPDLSGLEPGQVELLACVQDPGAARTPPEVRRVDLESTGVARSRNAALRNARGRYLLFCDDDIEVRLDGVRRTADHLAGSGHALALGAAVDELGRPRKRYVSRVRRLGLFGAAKAATYEMVVDVDAARAGGLAFDERFGAGAPLPLGDEYIFIADLLRSGLRADATPWVLAMHPTESSGHRWGTDADAGHRAAVLDRVFGRAAPVARLLFAARNRRRFGSLGRTARFVLGRLGPTAGASAREGQRPS